MADRLSEESKYFDNHNDIAQISRGYCDDDVRKRILSERSNWRNHQGERRIRLYLDRAIERARLVVDKT